MGNTISSPSYFWLSRDHPHIYGEYAIFITHELAESGSPPYIWGIHGGFTNSDWEKRITPIYMGNTEFYHSHGHRIEDHPHIYGEYSK